MRAHHEQVWSVADWKLVALGWREGKKQPEQDLTHKYWDNQIQLSFDHWARDFLLVQVQPAAAQTAEELLERRRQAWRRKDCPGWPSPSCHDRWWRGAKSRWKAGATAGKRSWTEEVWGR